MKKKTVVTEKMRQTIRKVAMQAGRIQMKGLGKRHKIHFKGEINLVTEVDFACEKAILKEIHKNFPEHAILAEESGQSANRSDYCWVIDPLDGTTNFAHAYPLFCISVALAYRGEPVLGVVYEPNLGEFFFAEKGKGSFLNGRRIHVSDTTLLKRSLLSTGFAYNIGETYKRSLAQFEGFLVSSQAIRRDGVAAVDLAYVAAGRFDGFWEINLWPWDVAAGLLLVKEAGGQVTLFNGKPFAIEDKEILASNGRIHPDMVKVLHGAGS
ncbi:MAG: inositol monophosphatase family protein [Deltaproteobacteria bacterium]|nr:inositol monophosphatase family protein [Deltaproteobacteria bacterium]